MESGPPCWGLSPRVRGNPLRVCRRGQQLGSIPACAGEPDEVDGGQCLHGVYPRVCGGPSSSSSSVNSNKGLSPRVRGNPGSAARLSKSQGSIPACAGEPVCCACAALLVRVYPRVCGGTDRSARAEHPVAGLSPRVRGNPPWRWNHCDMNRSIPACAGEPPWRTRTRGRRRVYPRVCGGTLARRACSRCQTGLSPRVRGNL